jgi:hypothetical protein
MPRMQPGKAMIGTLLLGACLTPTDGGARFGELRVQPVFSAEEAPGAIGVEVDSIGIIARNTGTDEIVVDTVMPYRAGAYAWVLELTGVSDDLTVMIDLRARSNAVYEGSRVVTVTEGQVGRAPTEDVEVAYVGDDIAARIELLPERLVFSMIGLARDIEATAYNDRDEPIVGKQFQWIEADPAMATVDQAGTVVATGTGSTTVRASVDGVTATASVLVDTDLARRADLSADSVAVDADGLSTSTVTVRVVDAHGELVGASAGTVVLAATLGTLDAVLDHRDGTYSAILTAGTVAGDAVVSGTLDGAAIEDSAVVAFRPLSPSPTTTTVDADSAAIDADGTSTTLVTVTVRDANGNPVGTGGASVALTTTRGTLGTSPTTETAHTAPPSRRAQSRVTRWSAARWTVRPSRAARSSRSGPSARAPRRRPSTRILPLSTPTAPPRPWSRSPSGMRMETRWARAAQSSR